MQAGVYRLSILWVIAAAKNLYDDQERRNNMTINDLKTYGANTSEGLQRCMNNESLYLKLVKMIPGDSSFQKLYDAIDSNDLGTAFNAAHALKGSTGNLALTPVFEPVSEITELLRAGTQTDYTALIDRIRKGRDELARICGD